MDNDVSRLCLKHGNSWLIRNDSTNVSAVLNSESCNFEYESNFLGKVKKPIVVSDHYCKTDKPQKFYCEECYCRRSPVYPKLSVKPPGHKYDELKFLRSKNLKHDCKCDYAKYYLTSLPNKKYSNMPDLQHVASKQIYKKYAPEYVEQSNIEAQKAYDDDDDDIKLEEQLKSGEVTKFENIDTEPFIEVSDHIKTNVAKTSKLQSRTCASPVLTTIIENEKEETNTKTSDDATASEIVVFNSNASTEVNLKKLNTFRKENYFDCHSTENLCNSKIPDHKCVHKFVLNDRLVPQPLHADTFGTSRCVICYKPINSGRNNCSQHDNKTLAKKTSKSPKNIFAKPCCCEHKTAHKICISNKNDRIEVKVPLSYETHDEIFRTCFKVKNPLSANSLALRHQKGVV